MSRRRGSGNKAAAQVRHAASRALQRFGLELDQAEAVRKITTGDGLVLQRQSNRVSIWLLHFTGKYVPVVYDRERRTIVTVLPFEFIKSLGHMHEQRVAAWIASQP